MEHGPLRKRPEERFGERVRELREAREWSQRDLAERMNARGYNWFQSTTAKTETGGRPIRLDEAATLAEIFNAQLDELIKHDPALHPLIARANKMKGIAEVAERRAEQSKLEARFKQVEHERDAAKAQIARRDSDALTPLIRYLTEGIPLNYDAIRRVVRSFHRRAEWRDILDELRLDNETLALADRAAEEFADQERSRIFGRKVDAQARLDEASDG